jgi:hypothetical protein
MEPTWKNGRAPCRRCEGPRSDSAWSYCRPCRVRLWRREPDALTDWMLIAFFGCLLGILLSLSF